MKRNGSVFIIFLWVLILMSLIAFSVAVRSRMAAKIEGYELLRFETNYDFLTGVNLARFYIDSDPDPRVDSAEDTWFGTPKGFEGTDFSKRFELEIGDEDSKINLNKAQYPLLLKLLEVLVKHGKKFNTKKEDLAASILAWRGMTAPGGKPQTGTELKRAPFESVDELRLIQYISPRDLETIRPYVTVYGTPYGGLSQININTAHPYVLEAVVFSLSGADSDKRELINRIEEFRNVKSKFFKNETQGSTQGSTQAAQFFGQADRSYQAMMTKLKIPTPTQGQMTPMAFLVSQLLASITVDTQYFSVQVRSKVPKRESFTLKAVLGQRYNTQLQWGMSSGSLARPVGQPVNAPLEILAWREGFTS